MVYSFSIAEMAELKRLEVRKTFQARPRDAAAILSLRSCSVDTEVGSFFFLSANCTPTAEPSRHMTLQVRETVALSFKNSVKVSGTSHAMVPIFAPDAEMS